MNSYPFPDKIMAREELKKDVLYHKIPEEDRIKICDDAWERGVHALHKVEENYPGKSIFEIAKLEGIKVSFTFQDMVNGGFRTFAEYYEEKNEMVLYSGSVGKWAKANQLGLKEAEEIVMAHEFFHFLENNRIGRTAEMVQIPLFRIGKLKVGKSGVRALSEISAYGFSWEYHTTHSIHL